MSVSVNVGNSPLEQYRVSELREELKKRGLGQKGVKKELVKRLEEALQREGQFDMLKMYVGASEDGHAESANSEEAVESDHEGKTEAVAESVIPDQFDSPLQNQQIPQTAGIVDARDALPFARDTTPVAIDCIETHSKEESKNGLTNETNNSTQVESNQGKLDVSGPLVQTQVVREVESLRVSGESDKASWVDVSGINAGESLEIDPKVSTLDTSMSKEKLEDNRGLASFESGEGHIQTNNAKIADDNREFIVENVKLEAADGEDACGTQYTASMIVNYSQPLLDPFTKQNHNEDNRELVSESMKVEAADVKDGFRVQHSASMIVNDSQPLLESCKIQKNKEETRELVVENMKLKAADGEDSCQAQSTAFMIVNDSSQPLLEPFKIQYHKEETISQVNICTVSEIKHEADYGPADNNKLNGGFVMFSDEVTNLSSEPFLSQKRVEQEEGVAADRGFTEQEKENSFDKKSGQYEKLVEAALASGKSSELKASEHISGYKDEKHGQYGKLLERAMASGKHSELKTSEHISGLQAHVTENSYKPFESDSRVYLGQKKKDGLHDGIMENTYNFVESDFRVYIGQKRKEEEIESRQQDPVKRQRRWNSGNNLTVEPVRALTTGTVKEITAVDGKEVSSSFVSPPIGTTKVVAVSRPAPAPVKADLVVNGGRERQRIVPSATRSPTTSLRIDRFLRPFRLKAVKDLLSETGTFTEFWMDQIKTHCYVTYSRVGEAIATRNALYNLQWPVSFGNLLIAEFVDPEEVTLRCEGQIDKPGNSYASPRTGVLPPPPPPPVLPVSSAIPDLLPPPPLMRERVIPVPVKDPEPSLDDLFRKTKAKPHIYYLPLTDDDVAVKLAAKKRELQIRDPSAKT